MNKDDKRLLNLRPQPFEKGSQRAIEAGRKSRRGKSLSTIIKEISADFDWNKVTLKNRKELEATYGKNGMDAVVYVLISKAISGDVRAIAELNKIGWGDKVDITTGGEKINLIDFTNARTNTKTDTDNPSD